jgi:hypothetical protein
MQYSRRFGCVFLGGDVGYHLFITFVYGLFNDAFSGTDHAASNGGITVNDELKRIWKEAVFQPSHGRTDKITKNLSQCPS